MELTREVAIKVRDTVDAGLVKGVGNPVAGQMCVEAAVCFALGLPHGDDPGCVSPSLRRLKIRLNDSAWSSDLARARGLRRLAVAQLGSKGAIDDVQFARRVVEMTIRKAVPVGLRAAATRLPEHAKALEAAAVRCEREGTREAAASAASAASAAAASASAYAAYAADASSDAASASAASAAAASAADASSDAASAAAAYDDARTRDRALAQYAEWVVEILIDMKAPGCEWLDLVPTQENV